MSKSYEPISCLAASVEFFRAPQPNISSYLTSCLCFRYVSLLDFTSATLTTPGNRVLLFEGLDQSDQFPGSRKGWKPSTTYTTPCSHWWQFSPPFIAFYSPLSPPSEWWTQMFPAFVAVHSHTHLAAEWSQTDWGNRFLGAVKHWDHWDFTDKKYFAGSLAIAWG